MPYYKETFRNRSVPSGAYTGPGSTTPTKLSDSFVAQDSVEMMTFRSRPHPMAVTSSEVLDISADPYAYFLDSTSREKYQARLNERGLKPQGAPDRGHAFELKRHIIAGKLHDVSTFATIPVPGQTTRFDNAFVFPEPGSAQFLNNVHTGTIRSPAPYKEVGLDVFAQQAYNKTAPTSVVFDAATFIGELREGIPMMAVHSSRNVLDALRGVGDGYLAAQFGWNPLVRDLQNAGKALARASSLLSENGKRVHRKLQLPTLSDSDMATYQRAASVISGETRGFVGPGFTGFPSGASQTSAGSAAATYRKTRSSKRWFEGEFSSFFKLGFDPNSYGDRLDALVNLKPTPQTLWELAPWSWMVDWFLRIEDTIEANQKAANDLLVMHYGYAMEHSVYTTEVEWRLVTTPDTSFNIWSGFPTHGRYWSSTEYKRRLRANPYGFRVGGAGALNGSQLAILGALGLTRAR